MIKYNAKLGQLWESNYAFLSLFMWYLNLQIITQVIVNQSKRLISPIQESSIQSIKHIRKPVIG